MFLLHIFMISQITIVIHITNQYLAIVATAHLKILYMPYTKTAREDTL